MITFTYQGKAEQFKEPTLGNTNELEFQRINRRSRGGDLQVYRNAQWPKTEKLGLHFNFSEEKDMIRLADLVRRSTGDVLTYADDEGNTYTGFFANPEAQYVASAIADFDIDLIFQVVA